MSTRAFTCHPTLTTTGPVPFKIQTTELVVINSSVPKGVGPHPRVLKCMDDYYLLPRSPESPTLQMQQRHESASLAVGISGSLRARHAAQYASTKVNKLKVEPLQVAQIPLPLRPRSATPSKNWSPTFPDIQAEVKHISVHHAPTFDPSDKHISSFSQLLSLDSLPALGLAKDEFWKLFSKCMVCHSFMTTRTVPYHICPGSGETENRFGAETIPKTFFLRLLDVHDAGHEAGVPEDIFKAIFYSCWQCGRYMTKRVSFNHNEVDSDMDDQGHTFACIYLTACVGSAFHARKTGTPQQVRTLKEFPTLEFV